MDYFFSDFLGKIFYTAFVFVAGGLIFPPLWKWAQNFFPWSKNDSSNQ